jgi:hypothetical protein
MPSFSSRLLVAALLLGSSTTALAGAGDGIRVGGADGRLHPFVELEGRYDTNVYVGLSGQKEADAILHVRPGLSLAVPGDLTTVDFYGMVDWAQYLGLNNDTANGVDTTKLSKLYAEAKLAVGVNKKGTVSLEITNLFRRSDQPQAQSLGAGVVSNYNALDVRVPYHPGGGALTLGVGAGWSLETYESFFSGFNCDPAINPLCDASKVSKLGYNQISANADVAWHFLPRTSALLEASYFKRLPNDSALGLDAGGVRVATGVTGLITPHLAATAKVGYGATLNVTPSLSTWLVLAQGEWLPTEFASVKGTYAHDFAVDPQFTYDVNRVALDAKYLAGGRLSLGFHAGWDRLGYASSSATTTILVASPSVGYEVAKWMRTELAYAYTDRSNSGLGAGTTVPVLDYTKSEAWLRLAFTY